MHPTYEYCQKGRNSVMHCVPRLFNCVLLNIGYNSWYENKDETSEFSKYRQEVGR